MIEKNGTNGGAREKLASLVNGSHDSISTQVLLFLKAIFDANMEPIDLATVEGRPEDREVFLNVVELLRDQEMIMGSLDQIVLTITGLRSLKAASASDFRVALFLGNGLPVLAEHEPTELLISILRAHFEEGPNA